MNQGSLHQKFRRISQLKQVIARKPLCLQTDDDRNNDRPITLYDRKIIAVIYHFSKVNEYYLREKIVIYYWSL